MLKSYWKRAAIILRWCCQTAWIMLPNCCWDHAEMMMEYLWKYTDILLVWYSSSISVVPWKWTLIYIYNIESIFGALLKYCMNIKPAQSHHHYSMIPATIWQHNTGSFTAPSQYDCSTFPVWFLHDLSSNLSTSQHTTWILLGNCSYVTGKLLRSCLSDPILQNLTKLNFL